MEHGGGLGERVIKLIVAVGAALILSTPAWGIAPSWVARADDTFEVRHEYQTEDKTGDGSSGSSSGHTAVIERVVAVRSDGLELEYDLPAEVTAQERAREWQLPARIFRPFQGEPQLLNRPELESRIDGWLKAAKLPREACGTWYFTWNAFKVECDPQSVLSTLEQYNLWVADLRDGASYRISGARGEATLKQVAGKNPASFVAEAEVDLETRRRERAEADVVVAQLMGKPITQEAALHARKAESISGTITVTLDTDESGKVQRRTTQALLTIKGADGKTETQSKKETVERRPISDPSRR
jgi:hypothetical protein